MCFSPLVEEAMKGAIFSKKLATAALAIILMPLCAWPRGLQGRTVAPTLTDDAQQGGSVREPSYDGKPLTFWVQALHNRDKEMMPSALEAIISIGPDARSAAPELVQIVSAPFAPIQLGVDPDKVIARKLEDIDFRSGAVDALGAIGQDASSATIPLIQWALKVRVLPAAVANAKDDALFVDMVAIDAIERMRVAGAVVSFGDSAFPTIARLLKSRDTETRKFATVILSENALPIASNLLKSRDCDDQQLGIEILTNLEPAVGRSYIAALKGMVVCEAD
jgi:hypothetical protein